MSKRDIWIPFYIPDYLADTTRLTTQQHGAYTLLIWDYWRAGPLPDDHDTLARITKVERREWTAKVWPALAGYFAKGEDGRLHQKRLDAELERAGRISEARREAAFARHSPRQQRSKPDANAHANASANKDANGDAKPPEPEPQTELLNGCEQPYAHVRAHDARLTPTVARQPPSPSEEGSELRSGDEAAAAPRNARDVLWQDGLPILRTITGLGTGQARGFLGRMLKTARDDCARTLAVLHEAADLRPVDPQAWLLAAAGTNAGKPSKLAYLDAYDGGNVLPFDAPPTIDADWPGAAQ